MNKINKRTRNEKDKAQKKIELGVYNEIHD